MAERSSKRKKKEHDFAVTAFRVVQEAVAEGQETGEKQAEPTPEERHAAAVILGRVGGKLGGKRRKDALTPERRKEIARIAAHARWKKSKG